MKEEDETVEDEDQQTTKNNPDDQQVDKQSPADLGVSVTMSKDSLDDAGMFES